MRKALFVLLTLSVMVFMMGGVAYAEGWANGLNPATHYNLTVGTDGCAGCHVTHVATAKYLLKQGPSQTDFCYMCHAGNIGSPYDVERGKILATDGVTLNDSTAGAFDFNNTGFGGTSRHDVETPGIEASGDFLAARIPGVKDTANNLLGGFRCGSCHDPHAGDKPNDRLLREAPITGGGTVTTVNFVYNASTLVVTDYGATKTALDGLNSYCGTCHNRFNVADNGGRTKDTYNKTRHAMGVAVNPAEMNTNTLKPYLGVKNNADPTLITASSTKNYINCLTCHYAHGSNKQKMTNYKVWQRDLASTDTDGSANFTENDSTLLRMDKRGVCYDCHGAGAYNLEGVGQTNNQ